MVYCRPFLDFSELLTAEKLDWYTDASGAIGIGGICTEKYFQFRWDDRFIRDCNPSIEFLELYAVTVSVLLWLKQFPNKRICIYVDNQSSMNMINNCVSNCRRCMKLVRIIVLECMTWNVRLFALYISSARNKFANALSRFQNQRFWKDAKKDEKLFTVQESVIPDELHPMIKFWK